MFSFHRRVVGLIVVAFVLHYIWENLHLPLYGGYEEVTDMSVTLYASMGDVLYTLGAVFLVALFKKRADWFMAPSARDLCGLALMGGFIAAFVEYKAFAFGYWFYMTDMPIVPVLGIGLSPLLQMVIILPLSVLLAAFLDRAVRGLFWPRPRADL